MYTVPGSICEHEPRFPSLLSSVSLGLQLPWSNEASSLYVFISKGLCFCFEADSQLWGLDVLAILLPRTSKVLT